MVWTKNYRFLHINSINLILHTYIKKTSCFCLPVIKITQESFFVVSKIFLKYFRYNFKRYQIIQSLTMFLFLKLAICISHAFYRSEYFIHFTNSNVSQDSELDLKYSL